MYESTDKNVSHPDHYMSANGIECIDAINAATEGLEGMEAVCTAQVLKYIWRWKKKNGVQDLEKAKWYLTYLIDRLGTPINEYEKRVNQKNNPDLKLISGMRMSTEVAARVSKAIVNYIDEYGFVNILDIFHILDIKDVPNDITTCEEYGWKNKDEIGMWLESNDEAGVPYYVLRFEDPMYIL